MSVKAGIVGASGYSGEELVGRLLRHANVALTAITSRQYAGRRLADIFPGFAHLPGAADLHFSEPDPESLARDCDVVMLALPHGVASQFAKPLVDRGVVVIDLSADFRLRDPDVYREYYGESHPCPKLLSEAVYGLPEFHREAIRKATLIASPGCYPTSILVPVGALLRAGVIRSQGIIADSLSGVSGAGRKVDLGYLFVECNESLRPYGVPKHRHLSEIEQELSAMAKGPVTIQFTPHLVPVNRGILTTLYLDPAETVDGEDAFRQCGRRVAEAYQTAYGAEPFIRLLPEDQLPDTKHVVGTNRVDIAWRLDPRTGRLIVMSAEDNLVKGAAGQAVQSLNIRFGFDETSGLL